MGCAVPLSSASTSSLATWCDDVPLEPGEVGTEERERIARGARFLGGSHASVAGALGTDAVQNNWGSGLGFLGVT